MGAGSKNQSASDRSGSCDSAVARRLSIDEIAHWERESAQRPDERWGYYARWHAALERLLAARGLCAGAEIEMRTADLAARPPGHDH